MALTPNEYAALQAAVDQASMSAQLYIEPLLAYDKKLTEGGMSDHVRGLLVLDLQQRMMDTTGFFSRGTE